MAEWDKLLPINHEISEKLQNDWSLALLYESAGMLKKATKLKKYCIRDLCKENQIPIIKGHYTRECGIQNWLGFDWNVKSLDETTVDVPVYILEKMSNVKNKDRLYIGFPNSRHKKDPVLLYMLPYHIGECYYIELARWE